MNLESVYIKGFRLSSKGFILLVGVSFCIKAIAQRQLIVNILIQLKGVKISDICPRNLAFFIMLLFSSRYKLARNYGFSNFSPTRQTITLLEKR